MSFDIIFGTRSFPIREIWHGRLKGHVNSYCAVECSRPVVHVNWCLPACTDDVCMCVCSWVICTVVVEWIAHIKTALCSWRASKGQKWSLLGNLGGTNLENTEMWENLMRHSSELHSVHCHMARIRFLRAELNSLMLYFNRKSSFCILTNYCTIQIKR